MEYLVIYDNAGYVLSQMSGDVREPAGIPFMWVEIPQDKIVKCVDTSDPDNHKIVLVDMSDLKYELMPLDETKKIRTEEFKQNLARYLEKNPIFSTCHIDDGAYYSITSDKQNHLLAMISVTQLKSQLNIEYQPSWNETGKACTYDWTIEELIQLSFEIEEVVRPLISRQQEVEEMIKICTTKEDVLEIDIEFADGKL